MKTHYFPPAQRALGIGIAITALAVCPARAVPYASGITNNAGAVSYYLNENADNVTIVFDGGGPGMTNNVGAQSKGRHSFTLGTHSSYRIVVTQAAPQGWVQTSADTNLFCQYPSPRGVAVNRNSANLSRFGRIYVSDSSPNGTVSITGSPSVRTNIGKGIFILNPDQSDALGRGFNASANGLMFNAPLTTSSPYRISVGPDDNKLYVNSFGTVDATTWRSDPDCSSFELVLDGVGENTNTTVHTDSANKPVVRGSTAAGNLKLWNLDGAYPGNYNSLAEWDIGSGPLPWSTAPTFPGANPGITSVKDVGTDLELGPDGKWYTLFYRSAGTDYGALRVYDTDGTTLLWDATTVFSVSSSNPDPLKTSRSCAISPDGKTLAIIRNDNAVTMFTLTNGIPDTNTFNTLVQSPTTGNGLGIAWDAAGNLYTVSAGQSLLRVWSPGGNTVATTGSDGSFAVKVTKPLATVSVVAATPIASPDTSQPAGVFTIFRAGNLASALTVNYTLSGTATNGVHYASPPGSVSVPANANSVNISVKPIPQAVAGPARTVVLTLAGSTDYSPIAPSTAEIDILDTNTPALFMTVGQSQMYERTNDWASFFVTRYGQTNVDVTVNVAYGGTAIKGKDFDGPSSVLIPAGAVTQDFQVTPIDNGVSELTDLTVTASVASGTGYTALTPSSSGPATILDAEAPPETVLWQDNFNTDTSTKWTVYFATISGAPDDYTLNNSVNSNGPWPYDYSALSIPPAPHAKDGSTLGLYMTVNKNDATAAAAALNLYPKGQSFSGNYALRFDMFLIENSSTYTTEYALFGINHSGAKTNWFRNSTAPFTGVDPTGWSFDGLFFDVEADGAALGDYVAYSSPTTASHNPTPLTPGRNASTLTGIFKSPPWTVGAGNGGAAANRPGTTTSMWADVEVAQIDNVITWRINRTVILAFTNATPYTSGNIMLGYCDAYDSIGSSGGSVVFDNIRVISLQRPQITSIHASSGNAQIDFTANVGDVPGQFQLQAAPVVAGPYADVTATISSSGAGSFRATTPMNGPGQFYRLRRIY